MKELCRKNKSLLIFDEVITGFRINLGGAQKFFGVNPDLSCFGKAMANGFPISAVTGKKKYMEIFDEIFFSFTFGGETSSIAASLATIEEIKKRGTINYVNKYGEKMKSEFNLLTSKFGIEKFVRMTGYGWWPLLCFFDENNKPSKLLESVFRQEITRLGILTRSGIFITGAHSDKVLDKTLHIFEKALKTISYGLKKNSLNSILDGKQIEPVIRAESSQK